MFDIYGGSYFIASTPEQFLARLEVGPVVPQVVVVDNDYPPLPPTGATSKRKTMATKPILTTTTTTATDTTIAITAATNQPSKDTR
ncbi:hypothetical protein BASA61_003204, partial [Batrachochytrium salamandrivorans]